MMTFPRNIEMKIYNKNGAKGLYCVCKSSPGIRDVCGDFKISSSPVELALRLQLSWNP